MSEPEIAGLPEPEIAGLPDPNVQPTMSVYPETAAILNLSKASAYAAVERGEIPSIRIGRRLLVPTAALRRMLQLDGTPAA
jgi:excisionase family DNA binding protein